MITAVHQGNFQHSVYHMKSLPDNFSVNLQKGIPAYSFWHFYNSVDLKTPNGVVTTEADVCYIFPPHTAMQFSAHGKLTVDLIMLDQNSATLWNTMGLNFEAIYYPHPAAFVTDLVWEIEEEFCSKGPYFEQMINTKLSELFIKIARVCNSESIPVSKELIERFHQIRLKMMSSLGENWTVARLADEVNISPSYFHAVYKEIYGVSPNQDLINARINSAKHMLEYSRDSIATVSKSLGYNNPYHFTRQFRQITGESPSKYRSKKS